MTGSTLLVAALLAGATYADVLLGWTRPADLVGFVPFLLAYADFWWADVHIFSGGMTDGKG